MRLQYILPAAAALIALGGPASAATVSSTFDTDAEGWGVGNIRSNISTAPDPSTPPTYNATGGNPGGYISTTDTQDIVAFLAPGKFLGDDAGFIGGSLSFDLQDTVGSDGVPYPAVVLYSSLGFSISYTALPPGTSWTSYSIPLTAAGWTGYPGGENNGVIPVTDKEFASVMSTIANIAIEADWHTGDDNTGLDNVVLASGGTPAVPEPSTWAMMITGLIGMAFLSVRGKRGVRVRNARA
jgi:hypothetical protein